MKKTITVWGGWLLLLVSAASWGVNLQQCGQDPNIKPGASCYVGTAWFCGATADSCKNEKPGGKTLEYSGKTCYGSGASCDTSCWTGNKFICTVTASEYKVDFARFKPLFQLLATHPDNEGKTADLLDLNRDVDALAKQNLHYYQTSWWATYKDPSPVKIGCEACVEGIGLLADVVGSLGWAVEGAGPFTSAGTSLIRFASEKMFGPSYISAIKQADQNESGITASMTETNLRNAVAGYMVAARAANRYISQNYNRDFDIVAEGESRDGIMGVLTGIGSPMGIERILVDQEALASEGLAAPRDMAVSAPSNVYAVGSWLYNVNTYLLVNRVAAVVNAYTVDCLLQQPDQRASCVIQNSEKTLDQLLKASWKKNNRFISNVIVNIYDPDNGFIQRATKMENRILSGMTARMRMISMTPNPVNFATCTSLQPGSGPFPAVDDQTFSGYAVRDTGLGKDYGVTSLLDIGGLRTDAASSATCIRNTLTILQPDLLLAAPMTAGMFGPSATDQASALQDARLWATWVMARYADVWGADYLPELRKNVENWKRLGQELCKAVPTDVPSNAATYCAAQR